jgi:hypothetical protein
VAGGASGRVAASAAATAACGETPSWRVGAGRARGRAGALPRSGKRRPRRRERLAGAEAPGGGGARGAALLAQVGAAAPVEGRGVPAWCYWRGGPACRPRPGRLGLRFSPRSPAVRSPLSFRPEDHRANFWVGERENWHSACLS